MHLFSTRRRQLLAVVSSPLLTTVSAHAASYKAQLAGLEGSFGGRLGVFALDAGNGAQLVHRADERFALCSTFKMMVAAGVLARVTKDAGLLQRRIELPREGFVTYSPVTEKNAGGSMTVAELCAAALQYSDNTAANALLKVCGGPKGLTAFAHSLGDKGFRLDRWEPALNSAIPGDARDTSTPGGMGRSLHRLLSDTQPGALPQAQRDQLREWMLGNTTGAERIRAGVPPGWAVADKTGAGAYGTVNDVAMVWPPGRAPAVISIYTTHKRKDAKGRGDVVVEAARIVAGWLG